ncbi:damage-inducible protein DinB [Thioalkalivibrio denitrificans]|uniref:Damage-inducible protein DinB n=1 Tax=Thioalkalivibrio denitrificans TaxID=108003 RepID=A0A1V3NC71_9GAMM|nr:DinB family protein [Thioalkalivibrio denitrificans]OOG22641.1 damage-inducible protein DinB [Thioalkalivibrio denitrificans]
MYDINMLTLMSHHNRWMNEKLYAVCASMSDDERRRDMAAFFRSIHGTFNHLLLVDRLWLGRMTGTPFSLESLDQELYADFATLARERVEKDAAIAALVATLDPVRLAEPVTYTSFLKRESVTLPLGLILIHLFHHQTHHRGQITTLISQLGYDFGDTDLIYMPGAATAYFGAQPLTAKGAQ